MRDVAYRFGILLGVLGFIYHDQGPSTKYGRQKYVVRRDAFT